MADSRYVPALGVRALTSLYDPVVRLTTRERRFKRRLIDLAAIRAGMSVLDLGCGTGTLAIWIKEIVPDAEVRALDGDAKVLERARAKALSLGVSVHWHEGLSTELPFPDAYFDRVVSSLFFHHLDLANKRRSLLEVSRVLRPGGELHVADWGRPSSFVARLAFLPVQLLDGFANTRDNVQGRLPVIFRETGLRAVTEESTLATIFGTLALYSAQKRTSLDRATSL